MLNPSVALAKRLPFFYGLVMVPVAMLLQITSSPGQTFAFSAFAPEFQRAFDLPQSQLTLAYMLGTFLAAFPLMAVGPLSDRIGLRWMSVAAVLGVSATCWFASTVQGWWTLLLTFLMLRFLGQGTLSLLGSNSIAMWYRSRIGRISALMSIGTAIAFAWVPGLISGSIESIGWRSTYQGISIVVVAVVVPVILLLFCDRPEFVGQLVDGISEDPISKQPSTQATSEPASMVAGQSLADQSHVMTMKQAMRTPAFWILAATNTWWALVGTGVVFYLYTLCNLWGHDNALGSDLFKTFGIAMLAGQLGGGVMADFLRLNRMLGLGTVMLCTGCGVLLANHSLFSMHAFAALFGGGQGLLLAVGAVVWVRYYGRDHLGTIRGTVWCFTVAGSGCGPLLMGLSKDYLGAFTPAISSFFLVLCVLSVTAWFAVDPIAIAVSKDDLATDV